MNFTQSGMLSYCISAFIPEQKFGFQIYSLTLVHLLLVLVHLVFQLPRHYLVFVLSCLAFLFCHSVFVKWLKLASHHFVKITIDLHGHFLLFVGPVCND